MLSSVAAPSLSSLLLLAALALVPIAFMCLTSFAKMSVVFSLLRNAIGAGQVPSGSIVAALATVLTLYVMAPVGEAMWTSAAPVLTASSVDGKEPSLSDWLAAADEGKKPLMGFLHRNAGKRELALFRDLSDRARHVPKGTQDAAETDFFVVFPAFLITELAEAFQIGFLLFLPFLVVDLVVANILLALGMHMLSPTTVSLPFKLLLFVLANGWYLIARGLVLGYA